MSITQKNLLEAIIVDIDGTVAIRGDRSPYDWSKVGLDTPNNYVLNVIWTLKEASKTNIVFLSGRDEICRQETIKWLNYQIHFDDYQLFMRAEGDMRKDSIVKEEIYNREIKDKYFVTAVFDDRLQVCRMWHKLGLPLFRVGDPDSNF